MLDPLLYFVQKVPLDIDLDFCTLFYNWLYCLTIVLHIPPQSISKQVQTRTTITACIWTQLLLLSKMGKLVKLLVLPWSQSLWRTKPLRQSNAFCCSSHCKNVTATYIQPHPPRRGNISQLFCSHNFVSFGVTITDTPTLCQREEENRNEMRNGTCREVRIGVKINILDRTETKPTWSIKFCGCEQDQYYAFGIILYLCR
jgi:hypothetical protein